PGILNWMIDGFLIWREGGLAPPAGVKAATNEYRATSDPIGDFLASGTIRRTGAEASAQDLWDCYRGYCNFMGTDHITRPSFGNYLSGRGIEKQKIGNVKYRGIEIKPDLMWVWPPPE